MGIPSAPSLFRKLFGYADRVGVDLDGVLEAAGVAARQHYRHRYVFRSYRLKDQAVTFFEAFEREFQSPKLILAVGIGASNVEDQVGAEFC